MLKDCSQYHIPVLFSASMEALNIKPTGVYLDGTMGGAGHASGILERLGLGGRLIASDRDPMAIHEGQKQLEKIKSDGSFCIVHREFGALDEYLSQMKTKLDGAFLDIGISSAQVDMAERGFSYMQDGPLDMRMDFSKGKTAADLVNTETESELIRIFREYGEERYTKRIVSAILQRRQLKFFKTTDELVDCIVRAIPRIARKEAQHPAKRVFQALRIAVNNELGQLERFLEFIPNYMNDGGRICIISFHSLEDRIIKQTFRNWENPCTCPSDFPYCVCGKKKMGKIIERKGIVATEEEIHENPRSRSARLRIFEIEKEADVNG